MSFLISLQLTGKDTLGMDYLAKQVVVDCVCVCGVESMRNTNCFHATMFQPVKGERGSFCVVTYFKLFFASA